MFSNIKSSISKFLFLLTIVSALVFLLGREEKEDNSELLKNTTIQSGIVILSSAETRQQKTTFTKKRIPKYLFIKEINENEDLESESEIRWMIKMTLPLMAIFAQDRTGGKGKPPKTTKKRPHKKGIVRTKSNSYYPECRNCYDTQGDFIPIFAMSAIALSFVYYVLKTTTTTTTSTTSTTTTTTTSTTSTTTTAPTTTAPTTTAPGRNRTPLSQMANLWEDVRPNGIGLYRDRLKPCKNLTASKKLTKRNFQESKMFALYNRSKGFEGGNISDQEKENHSIETKLDAHVWLSFVNEIWSSSIHNPIAGKQCTLEAICRMNRVAANGADWTGMLVFLSSIPLSMMLHHSENEGFTSYLNASFVGFSGNDCFEYKC